MFFKGRRPALSGAKSSALLAVFSNAVAPLLSHHRHQACSTTCLASIPMGEGRGGIGRGGRKKAEERIAGRAYVGPPRSPDKMSGTGFAGKGANATFAREGIDFTRTADGGLLIWTKVLSSGGVILLAHVEFSVLWWYGQQGQEL